MSLTTCCNTPEGDLVVGATLLARVCARIERLWRDVYQAVFRSLKTVGLLDPDNELDLFTEAWNNHKLSTEHNKTPMQLFIIGMHQVANESGIIPSEYFANAFVINVLQVISKYVFLGIRDTSTSSCTSIFCLDIFFIYPKYVGYIFEINHIIFVVKTFF